MKYIWLFILSLCMLSANAQTVDELLAEARKYEVGDGILKNPYRAAELYKKAAATGDQKARLTLARKYQWENNGIGRDYSESIRLLKDLVLEGNSDAMWELGNFYRLGMGIAKDEEQAYKLYLSAAEKGNPVALYRLGYCYEKGIGTSTDESQQQFCYDAAFKALLSSDGSDLNICRYLGHCYYFGNGVELDYAEAVKWYRKAAEQGLADAQCNLGYCFKNGNGVTQDDADAVKWWRKAAEQGDAGAQYNLGVCYDNGRGVTQDYAEAVKWLRKAAEQGHEGAKEALGNLGENY